jgi:hypothetical protein
MTRRFSILSFCLGLGLLLLPCVIDAAEVPPIVEKVIQHRQFFARLGGYDDYLLCDVERVSEERIGLVLLSAVGFERHLVFDVTNHKVFHDDSFIPERRQREKMIETGIRVDDARKLAVLVLRKK